MSRKIFKIAYLYIFNKSVIRNSSIKVMKQSYAGQCTQTSIISKFFCLAFINFISVAKVEPNKNIKNGSEKGNKESSVHLLINQSDELFLIGKYEESFRILDSAKHSENVEVLWRLARAYYNMSKQKGISKAENALLINEAYGYIDKALQMDKKNYAVHKWMAILYDAKSALEGIKSRINALPVFKQHLMMAIELNPKDATSIYMLGQYFYNIADMSKLQKLIAKTLFGTPPEATFEEAFYYFHKAEEVDPNFYSANLLMLGKTSIKLKRIEAARYWLKCAISYPVRTDEDEAVRLEAEELLKKYPAVEKEKNEENLKH